MSPGKRDNNSKNDNQGHNHGNQNRNGRQNKRGRRTTTPITNKHKTMGNRWKKGPLRNEHLTTTNSAVTNQPQVNPSGNSDASAKVENKIEIVIQQNASADAHSGSESHVTNPLESSTKPSNGNHKQGAKKNSRKSQQAKKHQ